MLKREIDSLFSLGYSLIEITDSELLWKLVSDAGRDPKDFTENLRFLLDVIGKRIHENFVV